MKHGNFLVYAPLALLMAVYAAIRGMYLTYLPIWDGLVFYRDCILKNATIPFNPLNYNCAGHPSMAYTLLIGLPQYLNTHSVVPVHLMILVLSLLSVFAFNKILLKLSDQKRASAEILLLTAMFAFYPPFIGSSIMVTLDYGVFLFSVYFLYAVLYKRWTLAVFTGVCLVFTKEFGALFYLTVVAGIFVYLFVKGGVSEVKKIRRAWLVGSAAPLVFYGLYILFMHFYGKPALWIRSGTLSYHFGLILNGYTKAFLTGLFVLNFNWIMTVVIVTAGIAALFFRKIRSPAVIAVGVVLALNIYAGTRFVTWSPIRYYLYLYPLVFLLFYRSVFVVFRAKSVRIAILAVLFVLFFISDFRTIDPVSKELYGTFRFGNHEMLCMSSVSGEWPGGCGIDQLVYNLEFTEFRTIFDRIYRHIGAAPLYEEFYPYDPGTLYTRLMKPPYSLQTSLHGMPIPEIAARYKTFYFVDYPWITDKIALRRFMADYSVSKTLRFTDNGYAIQVYKFERQ